MEFFDKVFWGNTATQWTISLLVLLVVLAVLEIVNSVAVRRLHALAEKTSNNLDDVLAELLSRTRFFFIAALAVYAASVPVTLPPKAEGAIHSLVVIAFLAQAAIWGTRGVAMWVSGYLARKDEMDASSVTTVTMMGYISRLVLWSLALLLALDNLGVDITALVAGLGIGGIAVALAAQNILGDLFASLAIVLDKPFVIGDFVIIGEFMGAVEHIGIKTTRIRSLSGEQLVFSNLDLLNSRIRNYKRMVERRIVFGFGVTYDTPADKLDAIPGMVRSIIEAQDAVRFDRAHFARYGDSSLEFEAVYFVNSGDYNLYMDIQQAINMGLFRKFGELGIEFAFPTRTLYVKQDEPVGNAQGAA